jgi:ABC-2 type transport system permease protein
VSRLLALALKELRQAARDPLSLAMLLGLPLGLLLLFGYALSFDVEHARLVVQDRDRSPASRELIASFANTRTFDLVGEAPPGTDLERLTAERAAQLALVIPEGYATELAAGRTAAVQLLLDGSDSNTATTLLNHATGLVSEFNAGLRAGWLARGGARPAPAVRYRPRVWYNPELESTPFLVPGLIAFILMITGVLATALSVVRERERGTLDQLRLTPLGPLQLILGKTLPYLAISLVATTLFLAAAATLFDVPVRGPLPQLYAVTLVYVLGALGWGLLVSTVARTQALAFQIGVLTSMLPAIFLSGFVFPIRAAPRPIQWVTYLVPARYYIEILRGIVLKGTGLAPFARPLSFLAIYALAVIAVAAARLRRREA